MPFDGSEGTGPPGRLDRPPSLPPEVQASTFNQMAGQADPTAGAGPSAGGMQIKTIVGQLAMQIEMLSLKLGQLVPGSEAFVGGIQQMVRQLAMNALTQDQTQQPMLQSQAPSPMSALAGGQPQGGPQEPPSMMMGGGPM